MGGRPKRPVEKHTRELFDPLPLVGPNLRFLIVDFYINLSYYFLCVIMNTTLISKIEQSYLKKAPELKPGDTVRVHQKIKEGNKERIQVFEGVVLRVKGGGLRTSFIVRKLSFGIGVEKCFLLHSPNIAKIEVKKRAKVRRAYLTYLRALRGKKARLKDQGFDALAVNVTDEPEAEETPEQTEDEKMDAAVTELDAEEMEEPTDDVPLDEVIKEENREAEADSGEAKISEEAEAGTDEAEVVGEEFSAGVSEADTDLEKGKATEGLKAEDSAEELTPEEVADEAKFDREADNE